jgi:Zn-dependent protease with chaperone function
VDFYARQEDARRTTRWLVLGFVVAVLAIVVAVDVIVWTIMSARTEGPPPVGAVVFATLVVVGIVGGASLFKTLQLRGGGGVVARSLGGTRVERSTGDPALKRLHNVVEEMSIASGVTMPEVYVLENEDGINAFAAGHSPADAAIAITRGAVTRLKREELQGVIAHEFSHVLNGDMRLNVRLMGLVFGLLVVAIIARVVLTHGPRNRGRRGNDAGGAIMFAALAVMVLGYIGVFFGRLMQAAVSRHRERLADASAVQFTRNPQGLTGALLKIAGVSTGSRIMAPEGEEVAHMLFAPGFARAFATHPSLEERLKELNPSLDVKQIPALAAEAARDAERIRALDARPGARAEEGAVSGGAAALQKVLAPVLGATVAAASDARAIAAQAGNIENEHVEYAERARLAIPEPLRDFVESADHARALVLVVLASHDAAVLAAQTAILERSYGAEFTGQVLALRPLAESLPPALRLPAVQQLFPALRRLSLPEREKLRDVVAELALADAQVDVFECCLTLLLAANLRDELEASAPHGSASLLQEIDAVTVLFSILAEQGAKDEAQARRAYEAGVSVVLSSNHPAFRSIDAWPAALGSALSRLAALKPLAKRVLIEGLVRCIAHDQKLAVAEAELLRTVCGVLHCPLPPILVRAQGAA